MPLEIKGMPYNNLKTSMGNQMWQRMYRIWFKLRYGQNNFKWDQDYGGGRQEAGQQMTGIFNRSRWDGHLFYYHRVTVFEAHIVSRLDVPFTFFLQTPYNQRS